MQIIYPIYLTGFHLSHDLPGLPRSKPEPKNSAFSLAQSSENSMETTHNQETYHRLRSQSQTSELGSIQEKSLEIWGRAARNFYQSPFPKVQAYKGPLPTGAKGIEFTTTTAPDTGSPPGIVSWSCDLNDIECQDGFAKLKVTTLINKV